MDKIVKFIEKPIIFLIINFFTIKYIYILGFEQFSDLNTSFIETILLIILLFTLNIISNLLSVVFKTKCIKKTINKLTFYDLFNAFLVHIIGITYRYEYISLKSDIFKTRIFTDFGFIFFVFCINMVISLAGIHISNKKIILQNNKNSLAILWIILFISIVSIFLYV